MTLFNRRAFFKASGLVAALGLTTLPTIRKDVPLTKLALGKQPARPHYGLKLRDYIKPHKLPAPPENFGHENLISDWQMLGNDTLGDCAIAGPYHALMLWCAEGKKTFNVDTPTVVASYSAITGYDPNAYDPWTMSNPTDQGSNVQDVAEYWRTKGLRDADGNAHKIDCYLALEPKNVEQLFQAMYLFDGVGIGVELPTEWQDAFNRGQVWDAVPNANIEGGHYILGAGSRAGHIQTVTWGRTQLLTAAGYEMFNDESFCYFDSEKLINGKDIDGFDVDQLMADMADLANDSTVFEPPTEPIPVCELAN